MAELAALQPHSDLGTLRRELAYGYRILGQAGLGRGLLAHLTARLPGSDTFWSYQFGQSVEEVRISDLREVNADIEVVSGDGMVNPTLKIHALAYAARPDINCIAHHHGDNSVAMGAIGANLQPFDRNSARWQGLVDIIEDYDNTHRIAEQGNAILDVLGGDKRALILKHHGRLSFVLIDLA